MKGSTDAISSGDTGKTVSPLGRESGSSPNRGHPKTLSFQYFFQHSYSWIIFLSLRSVLQSRLRRGSYCRCKITPGGTIGVDMNLKAFTRAELWMDKMSSEPIANQHQNRSRTYRKKFRCGDSTFFSCTGGR